MKTKYISRQHVGECEFLEQKIVFSTSTLCWAICQLWASLFRWFLRRSRTTWRLSAICQTHNRLCNRFRLLLKKQQYYYFGPVAFYRTRYVKQTIKNILLPKHWMASKAVLTEFSAVKSTTPAQSLLHTWPLSQALLTLYK